MAAELYKYSYDNYADRTENASESFRRSVKYIIKDALAKGLDTTEGAIDDLVIQICYRAADFGYLLDLEGKKLSDYTE